MRRPLTERMGKKWEKVQDMRNELRKTTDKFNASMRHPNAKVRSQNAARAAQFLGATGKSMGGGEWQRRAASGQTLW